MTYRPNALAVSRADSIRRFRILDGGFTAGLVAICHIHDFPLTGTDLRPYPRETAPRPGWQVPDEFVIDADARKVTGWRGCSRTGTAAPPGPGSALDGEGEMT